MSYADRSIPNGDRDDYLEDDVNESEVVDKDNLDNVSDKVETVEQPAPVANKTPKMEKTPTEFDYERYEKNRDKFLYEHKYKYWEWERFRLFAMSVEKFYKAVAREFYMYYAEFDIHPLPYTDTYPNEERLRTLADDCMAKGQALENQFAKSPRTLDAMMNAHEYLRRVRNYAADAWLMYDVLNRDIDLHFSTPYCFKQVNEKQNKTPDEQVEAVRLAVNAYLTYEVKMPNDYFVKRTNQTGLFKSVNNAQIYNDISTAIGGAKIEECKEYKNYVRDHLDEFKDLGFHYEMIRFYSKYKKINHYIRVLNDISHRVKQGETQYIYPYSVELKYLDIENRIDKSKFDPETQELLAKRVDVYATCKNIRDRYTTLYNEIPEDKMRWEKDVKVQLDKLHIALLGGKQIYQEKHLAIDNISIEQIKEDLFGKKN